MLATAPTAGGGALAQCVALIQLRQEVVPLAQGVTPAQQRQKLLLSVIKACCQAVDEAAGTSFAAQEQQIEREARQEMQKGLDKHPGDVRSAALGGVMFAWNARSSGLLPRMHYVVASAQMQTSGQPASSGCGEPSSVAVPLLALQRDVAVSAVGCCAATGCSRGESVWAWQRPAYLCAGCRVARYCRYDVRGRPPMGLCEVAGCADTEEMVVMMQAVLATACEVCGAKCPRLE